MKLFRAGTSIVLKKYRTCITSRSSGKSKNFTIEEYLIVIRRGAHFKMQGTEGGLFLHHNSLKDSVYKNFFRLDHNLK